MRAAYRAGDTSPGTALALTVHAEICAICRADLQRFASSSAPGGRIAAGRSRSGRRSAAAAATAGIESLAIGELRQEPWRWRSPGMRTAELHGASGLGEAIYLLKLAPGRAIPAKGVRAIDHLVILAGALRDGGKRYEAGDYLDLADQSLGRPVADRPDGCLCLLITEGSWPRPDLLSRLRRGED